MAVLGVFSVKIFVRHDGQYFTNGGFGDYLEKMCDAFDRVILCCKVRSGPPPEGFYQVDHVNLRLVAIPLLTTELGAMLLQPLVFAKGLGFMGEVDVVHARMPDWFGITGAVVARIGGKPRFHQIVDDWHGLAGTISARKRFGLGLLLKGALYLYDWLERRVSRWQLVFAQGQVAYDKHRDRADAHLVLSSAHHDRDIGAVTPRCGGDRLSVVAVGRLNAVKNHALLIRAIHRLRQQDPRWRLSIIGEGGKRAELEALIAELGLGDAVHLLGSVRHGDALWAHYDRADMFVLPSVSEGTPKVVLEAMARGCPVVASRVSGVPTAVAHEERGLLFESGDLDGLVTMMARMADDGALREWCQHKAWAFAKLHTLEQTTGFMLAKVVERWPHLAPLRHAHG